MHIRRIVGTCESALQTSKFPALQPGTLTVPQDLYIHTPVINAFVAQEAVPGKKPLPPHHYFTPLHATTAALRLLDATSRPIIGNG
eukprot:250502-Chlamydomonas_euryale.AAC.6